MKIEIKLITPDEVEAYWQLRLLALQDSPEAFGATYEDSVGTPLDTVRGRIQLQADNFILGAYTEEGELVGMVGFRRYDGTKVQHKGFVWGMFVSPKARQQSVGRKLLQHLLERVERVEDLDQVTLMVVTSNEQARKLYLSLGFEVYGLERCALKYRGVYYDEELMVYRLNRS
ncbi:GNAT family N-acetyltransferase [Paenibacillus sp. OV219]|uniref:GNAT family N-acetyltransferase n=1 Tax=Paenibacillus sp. OV219 TaxID=1884377 RepID=UPI0008B5A0C0|nr:GNAT family N-acetyltransferase [Paenibacillus sp. OV219]SEO94023.1 Protein N-acetyltransferase, RimJ/RimL family [Paenibacillus sp. OV219]